MTFFESLLLLLLAAVVLLQLARRTAQPYPAMLAAAGVAVAFLPGAPAIAMDPETSLALFIAPVLLDAAYDFPVSMAGTLWRPLVALAAGAVLASAAAVALLGWWMAGLPVAAALVLGAIVAPPDAAAAVAVLATVSLPRRTVAVLKGESLFNDAVALLLFNGALTVEMGGGFDRITALHLAVAVPGGIALGVVFGLVMPRIGRYAGDTLSGNVLQFLNAFLVWVIADHLHLSAVLAEVAFAMTVARATEAGSSPRMRVHSLAVWASAVFLLNVLAFLMMGMQAHAILARIPPGQLWGAASFVLCVVAVLTVARFAVVIPWNRLAARFRAFRGNLPAPTLGQGVAVAWSGMRGLVTLATAFALPAGFPQRDLVVLTAFGVVLATLVAQGLTLAPLIRRLRLDRMEDLAHDLAEARRTLAEIGLQHAGAAPGGHDVTLRELYQIKSADPSAGADEQLGGYRRLGLAVAGAQRAAIRRMRDEQRIDSDAYYILQEEIDWRELALLPDDQRRIHEI